MRRPLWLVLLVVAAGAAGGYWYANSAATSRQPTGTASSRTARQEVRPEAGAGQSVTDQIRQAVEALTEAAAKNPEESALPEGTRLLSLQVKGDMVIMDLSSEFSGVNNMGNTGESIAQRALLKCLAPFPSLKRLRVLMDGKVFEGEHSGSWEALPVHDLAAEASAAR